MRQKLLLALSLTAALFGSAQAEHAKPPPDAQAGKVEATEDAVGMQATTTKFNA